MGCKPCFASKVYRLILSDVQVPTEKLARLARIAADMALNVIQLLGDLPEAQRGYFTRAQAVAAGVEDFELTRSVNHGFINRLDHGVYRVAGAGYDEHEDLRVAWFRLQPSAGPRDRVREPTIWVSHESAASLHGFGVYLADRPTFITVDRAQPRTGVKVHRRSDGLKGSEYTVIDGFAVTTIARTAADLARAKSDGGHLGRFIDEAIRAQAVSLDEVAKAMKLTTSEVWSMIAMDSQPASQ
jgi:predicted transcriptional regulator of viral defense system